MVVPSFPTIDNLNIQAALTEAAHQESGTILNDHYSPYFYIERRAHFLGRHPSYAHIWNGLFEIACLDADAVYGDCEGDLSVQEVRRREITHQVVPFLPFPTTCNTESLNNFAGLPDSEWAEGKEGVYHGLSPTPSPPPAPVRLMDDVSSRRTKTGKSRPKGVEVGQRGQQADDDDLFPAQGLKRDSGVSLQTTLAGLQRGDTAQQPPVVQGMEIVPGILNQLDRLFPADRNGAGVMTANTAADASAKAPRPTRRASSGQIVRPAPSYRSSGSREPIKYKRGTKRPRIGPTETTESVSTDSEAGNDSSYSGDETLAPPRKRLKINLGPRHAQPKKQSSRATEARSSEEVEEAAPRKSSAPNRKVDTSTTTKSSGPSIDAIVSGASLPRNRAQAQTADDARYNLVLTRQKAALRRRKKKVQDEPDIMPEYFHASNFPAGQTRDQVRCVCGMTHDDGKQMVCCDEQGCSVWQHVVCVGEAAPRDLNGGQYRCHNCDPWAHRRSIQGLRRGNRWRGGKKAMT